MSFAQRITAIRKGLKLSQEKFGELAGVSQRTVAFWESGERTPSNSVLTDLANKLNLSVDYLLGRSDAPKIKEPAVSDDELRAQTFNRIKALPLPVLEKILDLIDVIQSDPAAGSVSPAPHGPSDPDAP